MIILMIRSIFERDSPKEKHFCLYVNYICLPPATVPCHKTENINMLSLQRGARHQGNSTDRQTETDTNTHAHLIVSQNTHCKHSSVIGQLCGSLCQFIDPAPAPPVTNPELSHDDFPSSSNGEVFFFFFFVQEQLEATVCHI